MSLLSIAFPAEAFLVSVEAFAVGALGLARPLFGFGMLATILVMFKPLLLGLLRAGLLLIRPRRTLEQRSRRRTLQSMLTISRLVRDLDASEPSQAAELRAVAARG